MNEEMLRDFGINGIEEVYEKALAIKYLSNDVEIRDPGCSLKFHANSMRMKYYIDGTFLVDGSPDVHSTSPTRFALSQLCAKIGIPSRYLFNCIDNGYADLVSDTVNTWLADYHKTLLIREYDDNIRGVLSNKFSILDSHEIIEVLKDVLDFDAFVPKSYYISEERLHLRLIEKEPLPVSDADGKDLYLGIQIDSSDVGRSVLKVSAFIFKQVCTNGLMLAQDSALLFKQRHVGISKEAFKDGLKESLAKLGSYKHLMSSMIEHAQNSGMIHDTLNTYYLEYLDNNDDGSMEQQEIERTCLKDVLLRYTGNSFSDDAVEDIQNLAVESYGMTDWGYINAITDYAKSKTLETRLELEKVAGTLIENSYARRDVKNA